MALTHEQDAIRQEASTLKDGDGLRAIAFAGAFTTRPETLSLMTQIANWRRGLPSGWRGVETAEPQ